MTNSLQFLGKKSWKSHIDTLQNLKKYITYNNDMIRNITSYTKSDFAKAFENDFIIKMSMLSKIKYTLIERFDESK